MRKLFATLLLTSLALPLRAQHNPALANQPVPPRAIAPAAEKPAEEKPVQSRSLLQRMFGPRATPTPTPTPAPDTKPHPKPKTKPAPAETPAETAPKVAAKVTPKVSPAETAPRTPTTTVKPRTGKGSAKKGKAAPVVASDVDDATRFKNAKTKAQEDAHIKELRSKADSEVNEADAHKALVSYNRALFQKIREIDPSVSDYASMVEQAMTKRLGAEKVKE